MENQNTEMVITADIERAPAHVAIGKINYGINQKGSMISSVLTTSLPISVMVSPH